MKPRRVSSIHFETEAGESSTATPRACTSRVYLACLCKSMVMIVTSTVPCIIRGRRSVSSKYHGHETSLCKSAGPQQQHEYWQQSQSLNKMAFSTTHTHSSKAFKNQSDCQFAVSACTVLRKACIQHLLHVRHIFAYSCMFLHVSAFCCMWVITSSTSAAPQELDTARLPCLATWAPAAAASTQAPVEMFTDPIPSPPVPTMSNTAGGMTLSDSELSTGQQKMPCRCPKSLCGLHWRPPDLMEVASDG